MQADAETARELWSVNDLARTHSVSRRHIYDLIERGELEGRKIGRLTVIPEASRRAWVDSLPRFQSTAASQQAAA
jgi:excisionase family DNA binding protein